MIADIHSHIHQIDTAQLSDIPEIIISSCTGFNELKSDLQTACRYKQIYIGAGIHPQIAETKKQLFFLQFLKKAAPFLTAIGEIGLDRHHTNPPIQEQINLLKEQLLLARQYEKPIILHCRNAFEALFDILDELQITVPMIMHGYSGGFKYLDEMLKRNIFISFGLSLTWPQSSKLQRIVSMVPGNLILAESDSPYGLNWRDRALINVPQNIIRVIEKIKNLRKDEAMEEQIWQNSCRIFDFDQGERNTWMENLHKLLTDFPF